MSNSGKRNARDIRHWLLKSEPTEFSWADLWGSLRRSASWDGVRNYQARNFMRDGMSPGDQIFFYHSNGNPPGIMGVAEVTRAAYPDPTAFDPGHDHFDPKSNIASPAWVMVDIRAVEPFTRPVTLPEMRGTPGLERMVLLQKGSRLSVQPVRPDEWTIIRALGMR